MREALVPLSSPNLSTFHVTKAMPAPRPSHQTAVQELQPHLCWKERWRCGIRSEGLGRMDDICRGCHLLILTALTVGSFPAVAFAPVAPRPEDAYALVHARVGFAQVHGAFCFCNKHKQNSRLRHIYRALIARTHVHQECCKNNSNYIFQTSKNVI